MTDHPTPPSAARHPTSIVRNGETFVDEFAWLRNKEDPAVLEYLKAENAYTKARMAPTEEFQDQLYLEMVHRIKQTDLSVPVRRGEYWYYTRTEEGRQYPIHCRKRTSVETGAEEILLDLNRMAEGKSFMALGDFAVSDDARFLAYSTDNTGYRQYTLVVKDLETGQHLPLSFARVTSVTWTADGRSLFYVVEDATTKRSHQLWRHDLDPAADHLILEEQDEAFSLGVGRTRSREWLLLRVGSHTTSECRVLRADTPQGDWRLLLPRATDIEYEVDHHANQFYLRINDTGRNFRIVSAPVDDVRPETLQEFIPHRTDVMLEGQDWFARHFVLSEREGGVPHLMVHRLMDGNTHRIVFPEPAYEAYVYANPEWDVDTLRLGYQSLVTPASVYDYEMESRERTLLKQEEIIGGYNPDEYFSERLEATAADGTKIPISLVRRADLAVDGTSPCLLHGYGAYGYTFPVTFSSGRLSLLQRGMVVAIAHVRGGGELGKPWHDAGRMAQKMNTFTDFITCAEHLIGTKRVAPDRLAIEGGSAGGLLMGAVTNLRPDLFAAVLSQVPFVDVLNTMSDASLPLTVGEYDEWGNPNIPEQFAWMRAYCPYTNLVAADYPAMLVRTSLNDSQVMYWEPAKYVAKMRLLKTSDTPLLFLTNLGAGHGGASGRYDRLNEIAGDYAFILDTLGVEGPSGIRGV